MDALWMGLIIFAVICIGFVFAFRITKAVAFVTNGNQKDLLHSNWIPFQVYSGDDVLGHPDLKKISELQDNKPVEEAENI